MASKPFWMPSSVHFPENGVTVAADEDVVPEVDVVDMVGEAACMRDGGGVTGCDWGVLGVVLGVDAWSLTVPRRLCDLVIRCGCSDIYWGLRPIT